MKKIKFALILLIYISCNNLENKYEENKYQILDLIYGDYSKYQMDFFISPIEKPPVPSSLSYKLNLSNKKDSLAKVKDYYKKEKKQIFAFDLKMNRYHNIRERKLRENIIGFDDLYKCFIISEKIDSLDIYKISPKNNDSLIIFKEGLLKKRVGVEFQKFDVFVSFSNITFNSNYSKAVVIGTRGFSGTDSNSIIYFFEKQNGKWRKLFEQTL